ncbi:MAG: DUF4399 domain-containing protein [Gemmatimonadaceae bacterium]
MQTSRQLWRLTYGAACMLIACGRAEQSGQGDTTTTAPPSLVEITAPADGDSVALPVTVRLGVVGVEVIAASGKVEAGKGHHHLVIDGEGPADSSPLPSPPAVIHLGTGATEYRIDSLTPGPHRVIAIFASGDHVPMRDVRRDTVTFIVR